MRNLFLIAALVLVSASAQAGPSRSLSLASSEQPAGQAVDKTEPKTVDPARTTEPTKPQPVAVAKPTRKHVSTEALVIFELHRHGIYW
jgi:hypothetical protein